MKATFAALAMAELNILLDGTMKEKGANGLKLTKMIKKPKSITFAINSDFQVAFTNEEEMKYSVDDEESTRRSIEKMNNSLNKQVSDEDLKSCFERTTNIEEIANNVLHAYGLKVQNNRAIFHKSATADLERYFKLSFTQLIAAVKYYEDCANLIHMNINLGDLVDDSTTATVSFEAGVFGDESDTSEDAKKQRNEAKQAIEKELNKNHYTKLVKTRATNMMKDILGLVPTQAGARSVILKGNHELMNFPSNDGVYTTAAERQATYINERSQQIYNPKVDGQDVDVRFIYLDSYDEFEFGKWKRLDKDYDQNKLQEVWDIKHDSSIIPWNGADWNYKSGDRKKLSEFIYPYTSGANSKPYNGKFGDEQQKWLQAQLMDAKNHNKKVFIFSHAQPNKRATEGFSWAIDGDAVKSILETYADIVLAVFCGHDHRGGFSEENGIPYITLQSPLNYHRGSGAAYGLVTVDLKSYKFTIEGNRDKLHTFLPVRTSNEYAEDTPLYNLRSPLNGWAKRTDEKIVDVLPIKDTHYGLPGSNQNEETSLHLLERVGLLDVIVDALRSTTAETGLRLESKFDQDQKEKIFHHLLSKGPMSDLEKKLEHLSEVEMILWNIRKTSDLEQKLEQMKSIDTLEKLLGYLRKFDWSLRKEYKMLGVPICNQCGNLELTFSKVKEEQHLRSAVERSLKHTLRFDDEGPDRKSVV